MTMPENYLTNARASLRDAQLSYDDGNWSLAISRAQEAVEFALKAALRLVTGSHERGHDLSSRAGRLGQLSTNANLFPDWFKLLIPRFEMISRVLFDMRELSKYGDEALGIPPNSLFKSYEAEAYLKSAQEIVDNCSILVEGGISNS